MNISPEIASLLRNRRAALWICQRYDLLPGEEPHDYGTSPAEAGLRYRFEADETDRTFARLYWNAVWFEGANSPVLRTLLEDEQSATSRRRLVVLASEADANAEVSPQGFLPAFVLPGLIESPAADSAYGAMSRRARESLAWTFARKLKEFPGTALVVLGAETSADLEFLWETLSDSPVRDLKVLLVWSGSPERLPKPSNALVDVQVYPGPSTELADELIEVGAPSAHAVAEATVRVGNVSVPLTSQDTQFVTKRLALLYESSFAAPGLLRPENLESFFDASLDDWSCYSTGVLPVPRSYRTDSGLTLEQETLSALNQIAIGGKGQRTFVLQIPAESASGATTLLHSAAYSAAEAGFPTLIMRPEQVELDTEDLVAFLTTLNDAVMSAGLIELPPILLVIDTEHAEINRTLARQVAQSLATQGRKAVILQALHAEGEEGRGSTRNERWAFLPTLQSRVTEREVADCAARFASLAKDWSLGSGVHTVEDWKRYHMASKIVGPSGRIESEALFWVALRFFVCEGAAFLQQDSLREALSSWIAKRMKLVVSEESRLLVNFVAALSFFRLVSPLMTVLRPISGSVISSTVVDTLRQLRDVADWRGYSPDLNDQVLTYRHPVIAHEYLRTIGINTEEQAVKLVRPIVEKLSPGGIGDIWLAEMLAATVLAPESRSRISDWDWRLEAFEWIPVAIAERSKTILHHWARCLSRSTDYISAEEKRVRLVAAIDKLEKALALERRPGRDEHPAHMFNTLGGVYYDLASYHEEQGEMREAETAWDKACRAFKDSIARLPGDNVIAYLAYSHRLLKHAKVWPNGNPVATEEELRDTARAVALLDEADEAISGIAAPEPSWRADVRKYKSIALKSLGEQKADEYIEELKQSDDPSLGYYCEARLRLGEHPSPEDVNAAAVILTTAIEDGIRLGPEALRLLAQLMRRSSRYRNDFEAQAQVYRELERAVGTGLNTIDMFRLAVLCFQTKEFAEGSERFRKLREIVRQAQSSHGPQRVTDFWRDAKGKKCISKVRVDKVFSDWRGEGYVVDIGQTVPLRPRHFTPIARVGEVRECMILFEIWGPWAVPVRLDRS